MKKQSIIKQIIKTIGVFILFYYSWVLQLIPVLLFNISNEALEKSSTNIMLSTFSSVVLGVILFFMYKNELIDEFKKFKKHFSKNMDTGLNYYVVGLVGMLLFNMIISYVFKGGQAGNEEAVQSMIGTLPWFMLINAGLLAPWNEELVFRKSIKKLFKNKWFYLGVSGLLFGLAHVIGNTESWTDWLFIFPYGSLGFAFAGAYYDTDTAFTPIAFHMIHNIVLVLISIFF